MQMAIDLAHDAYADCGGSLSREQFGVYAWCHAELECAAWEIYLAITKH